MEVEVSFSEKYEFSNKKPEMSYYKTYFLEDKNETQKMEVSINNCRSLKLLMKSFYDFYGRVIVYDMKVVGRKI